MIFVAFILEKFIAMFSENISSINFENIIYQLKKNKTKN